MSESVTAAVIGVGGTLSGVLVTAIVATLSARASWAREREADADRHRFARAMHLDNERLTVYCQWLASTESLARSASDGTRTALPEDLTESSVRIRLLGSPAVCRAVDQELMAWQARDRALSAVASGEPTALELHEETLETMRLEFIND